MDINNEFWVVLDGHCINRAHMTKESMVPQSPLYEPWGVNVLASLSVNVKPVIRKQLLWFQGPCCVAAMIWSEFVFLLTQSLLHVITIMLNHREFINTVMRYCTWLLLQVLVILCSYSHFWIKKNKYMYYWVYYKTISSV